MKGWIVTVIVAIVSFVVLQAALAEDEKPSNKKEVIELKEIVVTATRRKISLNDAPASVTVIDKEALKKFPAVTVDDILRLVAGIDNWGSSECDQGFRKVWLRGVGEQGRTLILVDGVPVNGGWSGWVAWGQMPLKENIERIEVVRGPASSLYGSGAMGGVINIITKMPERKPTKVRLKSAYGNLDTYSLLGAISGRVEKFGYSLSGQYSSSEGYKPYPSPHKSYHTKNEYDMNNLDGQFFYFFEKDSYLKLAASYFHEERNRGRRYSKVDPREIGKLSLSYRHDTVGGISWLSSIYWHNERAEIEFDKPPTYDFLYMVEDFRTPFCGAMIQPSIPLRDWNTLTIGLEVKHYKVEKEDKYPRSTRRAKHQGKQNYLALYLQDEMSFFDHRFLLTLGARQEWWKSYDGSSWDTNPAPHSPFHYDYGSDSWSAFNPKLGVVFHLTDITTLRGSVGTAFRAPTPARQYANLIRGPKLILGNPELDPEKFFSFETGIDHYFTDSIFAKLTLYRSIGKDFIRARLKTPPFIYQFDNISKVRIQGLELELGYKISNKWSCFANYTYNKSIIKEDEVNPTLEGNDLPYTPRNKFNFGITYDNPKLFTITAIVRFTDKMYDDMENNIKLDKYWTTDIKLSRKIDNRAELSVAVENIFNKHYDVPSFDIYKSPGRIWNVSFSLNF